MRRPLPLVALLLAAACSSPTARSTSSAPLSTPSPALPPAVTATSPVPKPAVAHPVRRPVKAVPRALPRAADLASLACGHQYAKSGPPPPAVVGGRDQQTIGGYDVLRVLARRNAVLAGQAAGQDGSWGPMAAAWTDLAEIFTTARQEYAATLANTATAEERKNLRELQTVSASTVAIITRACLRAP